MDWYQVCGVISLDGLNFSTACTYTVFEIIKTYQFMSFNTLINVNSYIENTIYNRNYRVLKWDVMTFSSQLLVVVVGVVRWCFFHKFISFLLYIYICIYIGAIAISL